MVERGPEKAGVGGSIPSLGTLPFNDLAGFSGKLTIHFLDFEDFARFE